MSGEIVTQDLGDGYYQHTYTVETYYLTETIISPVALPPSDTAANAYLMAPQPLGEYEPYRLSQCVQPRDAIVEKGRLVELASVKEGKLQINQEAIDVFRRYSDYDISFVGNYGRNSSGKSFWYDKILNLSQFDGNNYSTNPKRQGIYFWSIPFTKGKLKFFLLDFVGFEGENQLSKEDEKLLDLELLLAQKFVIVPQPEDENLTILGVAYQQLLESQKRFTDKGVVANKFSPYWPNEIYTLYRSAKPVRKEIDNIGTLFEVYNFSILHDAINPGSQGTKKDLSKSTVLAQSEAAPLNQKYVRMTSIVFQDIYEKMKGKDYRGVTFNGDNLPKILEQAKLAINNGGVKVDEIFKGVNKDISQDTYLRSKMLFIKEVEPLTKDGKPKPTDELIEAFDRGNTAALTFLDNSELNRKDRDLVEVRLRTDLDAMEQEIMKENQRKTFAHYSRILPSPTSNDTQQVFLNSLKKKYSKEKDQNNLDHNDTTPVALQLRSASKLAPLTEVKEGENQKILEMKKKLAQSKRSLILIKENKNKESQDNELRASKNQLGERERNLETKFLYLQKQIDETKKITRQNPNEKEETLRKLREEHSKNQEYKSKLADQEPENEEIKVVQELLRRQIAKNRQHEDGIASLEKSFMSNRSGRSIIREVKEENIKKVSIK